MTQMNMGGHPQHNASRQQRIAGGEWGDYEQHFRRAYRETAYYSTGRGWPDYAPAYRYGFDQYGRYRGRRFEDVETQLEHGWAAARVGSRLAWAEARGAVRDIWQRIAQSEPAAVRPQ